MNYRHDEVAHDQSKIQYESFSPIFTFASSRARNVKVTDKPTNANRHGHILWKYNLGVFDTAKESSMQKCANWKFRKCAFRKLMFNANNLCATLSSSADTISLKRTTMVDKEALPDMS